ncbi:MAG: hypothetical protein LH630_07200 [Actinomycetia bacterium]|nr:hypothetical protein [Actinomycetes bacterium]
MSSSGVSSSGVSSSGSPVRMAPHYCPYCADQDLRPHEQGHTAWECRGCLRVFSLTFAGISGVTS